MFTAAITFGAALVTGAVLTPVVRDYAHRFGAVDHALTSRKVHVRPTPRLGGVAIIAAFFAPLVALSLLTNRVASAIAQERAAAAAVVLGGAAIAALGVYDDVRGAGAKLKFVVQFGVASIAYALGFRILSIVTPFGSIGLGWVAFPFTVCFVVGVINAVNLIDGLDGLAGGVALLCAATFFVAAALQGDALTMWLTAALAGAVLGFLIYNFNPASIFMGDTGSLFLGFVLALTAIRSHATGGGAVAITAPVIVLGVPISDTLLAILRRAARGVPLFRGDREHIHHKLLARGLSHRGVALVLYAATATLGAAGLALRFVHELGAVLVVVAVAIGAAGGLRRLGYLRVDRLNEALAVRGKNRRIQREMAQVGVELQRASTLGEVATAIHRAASILEARSACAELVLNDAERRTVRITDRRKARPSIVPSRHGLLAERPDKGFLEFGWSRERGMIERDTEVAIESLSEHVRTALEGVAERSSNVLAISLLPPGLIDRASMIPLQHSAAPQSQRPSARPSQLPNSRPSQLPPAERAA